MQVRSIFYLLTALTPVYIWLCTFFAYVLGKVDFAVNFVILFTKVTKSALSDSSVLAGVAPSEISPAIAAGLVVGLLPTNQPMVTKVAYAAIPIIGYILMLHLSSFVDSDSFNKMFQGMQAFDPSITDSDVSDYVSSMVKFLGQFRPFLLAIVTSLLGISFLRK